MCEWGGLFKLPEHPCTCVGNLELDGLVHADHVSIFNFNASSYNRQQTHIFLHPRGVDKPPGKKRHRGWCGQHFTELVAAEALEKSRSLGTSNCDKTIPPAGVPEHES